MITYMKKELSES